MKRFGFGKKSSAADDASAAGRRPESPPPAYNANPYAAQPAANDDPYAGQKYANMPGLPSGPRVGGLPSGPRVGGLPSGPGPRAGPGPGAGPGPRGGEPKRDANPYANGTASSYGGRDNYAASSGSSGGYGSPIAPITPSGYSPGPNQAPSGSTGGYSNQKYGNQGGYGSSQNNYSTSNRNEYNQNAFAANQQIGALPSGPRRAGGYGGLGSADEDDTNKDALFSSVQGGRDQGGRYATTTGVDQQQSTSDKYGGYGAERELTEEEKETLEIQNTRNQIRQGKIDTKVSLKKSLANADRAEAAVMNSLSNLGIQGDRLHNTELHLDLAANQNKRAQQETDTLRRLNRSMFRPVMGNPLTSGKRLEAERAKMMEQHHFEREQAAATRKARYDSSTNMDKTWRGLETLPAVKATPRNAANRTKYQFFDEDDDEEARAADDAIEDEIDHDTGLIEQKAERLHYLAKAVGTIVDEQNQMIDRITAKSDAVDDQVRLNRDALSRIR